MEAAAMRETKEETGLSSYSLTHVGNLNFCLESASGWSSFCKVFFVNKFSGNLIRETEECTTHWIALEKIPWEQMWECDKFWLPLAIKKEFFDESYHFDKNDRLKK